MQFEAIHPGYGRQTGMHSAEFQGSGRYCQRRGVCDHLPSWCLVPGSPTFQRPGCRIKDSRIRAVDCAVLSTDFTTGFRSGG